MTDNPPARPQPSAKPPAWLYELPNGEESLLRKQNSWGHPDYEGWTETPLYTADQLQAYGDARARW